MTPQQPHPQRCETCEHREIVHNHGMGTYRPRCKITKWFLDAYAPTTIEHDFIDKLGCASYSSASGPAPEPNPCEENGCTDIENCDEICEHMRIYSPAYVRESRQKARAEVLESIATYCACHGIEERIVSGERFYEVPGTFSLADFLNYIASLRQQEGKP